MQINLKRLKNRLAESDFPMCAERTETYTTRLKTKPQTLPKQDFKHTKNTI